MSQRAQTKPTGQKLTPSAPAGTTAPPAGGRGRGGTSQLSPTAVGGTTTAARGAAGSASSGNPVTFPAVASPSAATAAAGAGGGEAAIISAAGQMARSAPTLHRKTAMESDFDRLRALDALADGADAIGPKGLQALCAELGCTLGDADSFLLAYKLNATQSLCVTRSEFLHCAFQNRLDHVGALKGAFAQWRTQLRDAVFLTWAAPAASSSSSSAAAAAGAAPGGSSAASAAGATITAANNVFTEVYYGAYDFIRGDEEKLLPLEKAIKAWTALLPEATRFPLLPMWCQYAAVEFKRPVSRDLWRQLLEFARRFAPRNTNGPVLAGGGSTAASAAGTGGASSGSPVLGPGTITVTPGVPPPSHMVTAAAVAALSAYNPNDKWPTVIDDFVEWVLEKSKPAGSGAAAGAPQGTAVSGASGARR